MRQKIRFEKNIKDDKFVILESSEVDPGIIKPLLEEEYSLDEVKNASSEGLRSFRRVIRRKSFFPPIDLCEKLYDNSIEFFKDDSQDKLIIEYDDSEAFPNHEEFRLDDDVELDKILEEDGDTNEDEMKEIDAGDDTPKFTPEDTSEHEN